MSELETWKNRLFEWRERRRVSFAGGLVVAGAGVGTVFGLGAELLLLGGVLGWMAWEMRPRFYLSLGMHTRAAEAAHRLALGAGASLRGDVFRLTEATARLNLGQLSEAKEALRDVESERLTPRCRLVHYLNQATLFSRLGDGETALAMVDAAEAEAEELDPPWRVFPAMNRSLALFEMGRYQEAATVLEDLDPPRLVPQARAYVLNNLAWATALGGGDADEALELAEKAVRLRRSDPYCRGTLGFCMVLAGGASQTALGYLRRSLERGRGRSPAGRALVLAACAQAYRLLGDGRRARELEDELASLPGAGRHLGRFRAALECAGQPVLVALPATTGAR